MADNTQNTGSSKKKKIAASALAVALAAALLIGGTFSYLSDTSDEVENDFSPNGNSVTLTESNGAEEGEEVDYEFDIVPGISETKDPIVTATYTLDSYVFLLVDDDTQDLVDYEINTAVYDDDGNITSGIWTLLYSEDESPIEGYAIYYKLVTTEDADESDEVTTYTETLNVITGDTVSYSSSLTSADMVDENGDLLTGITLSFKALIIQAEPFDDAAEALSGYLGLLGKAETDYDDDDTSDTILKVSVNTTVANEETDDDGNATTTSSTFTLTIPTSTAIVGTATTTSEDGTTSSSTSTPTSLTLSVTETTADTVAVVPDGDAGDYTYEISLVDQDGDSVTATDGYMSVAIQIKSGITASNLTVTKLGDSDTTLSTISDTSSISSEGYTYDSTTGILTIYTQSLGEYEISWNDTGLSLSALTGDDLTFTQYNTTNNFSGTAFGGVKVVDSNQNTTGGHNFTTGYDDWLVDVVLTSDTSVTSQIFSLCGYDSTNSSEQCFGYQRWTYTAGTEIRLMAKSGKETAFIYSQKVWSGSDSWTLYNVKYGLYQKSGNTISGQTFTYELRLYEGSYSGSTYTETGNYISLGTLSVTMN